MVYLVDDAACLCMRRGRPLCCQRLLLLLLVLLLLSGCFW